MIYSINVSAATVASSLLISKAISSIPADGRPHPAFFINTQDSSRNPRPLPYPLNVTISCSDEESLQIQDQVVIDAASYYVIVNATSNVTERKSVEVTVSAPGLQSSKVTTVVEPPEGTPRGLKVTILPDILLPLESAEADVIVTVVDAYGNPTKSRSDLNIALSSSNLRVADVISKNIKIPKGSISVKTKVVTTGFEGTSTITALITDLKSDSATITVKGPRAEKIYLWSLSKLLLYDPNYVFVAVVDSSLKPVKLVKPLTISLYSSGAGIVSIQKSVTIGVGEWKAYVKVVCKSVGQATIYATAENFTTTNIRVTVVDLSDIIQGIKIYSLADNLLVDEENYTTMVVQAVDSRGNPTRNIFPFSKIDLYTSNAAIFDIPSSVSIKYGSSYANVTATPKLTGSVKVTAVAQDLTAAETTVSVYAPTPDTIIIQTPPIPSEGEVEACLVTTRSGAPLPVQQDTEILLTSSNTDVGGCNSLITLIKKDYFTYLQVKGYSPGQFDITALASGIPSSKTSLSVLETRASKFDLYYMKPLINYYFPVIIQLVSSSGRPAVLYEPVTITIIPDLESNIMLPDTTTINAENTEALIFGKALTQVSTTFTLLSPGFRSQTVQITAIPINISLEILAKEGYKAGETVTIMAKVTLEGAAVQGIMVIWKGEGLEKNDTMTNAEGLAENTLSLRERENTIEAAISIGGSGYLSATKIIFGGLGVYILNVAANVPVTITGSGSYSFGDEVLLNAPPSASMPGIYGLLGGKYYFRQWMGEITSTRNTATITMGGGQQNIDVQAIYSEDYSMVTITAAIITVVFAAVLSIIYFRVLRKR
jgi:hypothetical protein